MIFRHAMILPLITMAMILPDAGAVIKPGKITTETKSQQIEDEGNNEDFYPEEDYSIEDYDHSADGYEEEYNGEEPDDSEAAGDLEDQKEADERLHGACGGHGSEDHETGAGNCQEDRNEIHTNPEALSPILIKARKKSGGKKVAGKGGAGSKKIMPIPCKGVRSDGGGAGNYGARRRNGKRRYTHTGVDWNSPLGSPFKSVADGKVTGAACSKRAGCTIRVTHSDGTRAVYMHLSPKFSVKVGANVKQGQVLGKTSNTGNAKGTNPHLHFEYYSASGKRMNPTSVFKCK